jgi:hypothetical protein
LVVGDWWLVGRGGFWVKGRIKGEYWPRTNTEGHRRRLADVEANWRILGWLFEVAVLVDCKLTWLFGCFQAISGRAMDAFLSVAIRVIRGK